MRNSGWLLTAGLALAFGQAACTTGQDEHMKSEKMMAEANTGWPVYGGDFYEHALRRERPDQRRQRQDPASQVDLPDRRDRLVRDHADGRDGVMYITTPYNTCCGRRAHRQADLALRAQARHHDLLLRPEQPRRGDLGRQALHGDPRREPGRARHEDRRVHWETEIADPEYGYPRRSRRPSTGTR